MTLLLTLLLSCALPGGGEPPVPATRPPPPATPAATAGVAQAQPSSPAEVTLRADPGARIILRDGRWCAALAGGVVRCGEAAGSGPEGGPVAGNDTPLTGASALAVFDDSLISLHTDGSLRATRMFGSSPPPALPSEAFGALARGADAGSCGLNLEGEPTCWGRRPANASAPPPGPFDGLAVSAGRACAVRPAGTLVCWSVYADDPLLKQVPQGLSASAVAVGANSVCATGVETRCWGRLASPTHPGALTRLSVNPGEPDAPDGLESACGITAEGTLFCWGNAGEPPVGRFLDVANHDDRTCALREDEQVLCWRHPLDYPAEPPGDGD